MKRQIWTSAMIILLLAVTGVLATAQSNQASRALMGRVLSSSEMPVPDAVVYLKNSKDLSVKTFIADRQGDYRFNALSPNVDYEVYAEHQGQRSDVKTLSSFDNRKTVTINLRIKK